MSHWCETCDRGFPSRHILENHKREHQMCKIDGCQFVAHPNVITKHIQMQHANGVFKKIANLNNPEDIQKWIEERKKKFPTKANIDRKIASIKEKINRGEKLGLGHKKEYNKHGMPAIKKVINPLPHGVSDSKKVFIIHSTTSTTSKAFSCHDSRTHGTEKTKKNNFWNNNLSKNNYRSKPKKKELVMPVLVEKHSLKSFIGLKNLVDNDVNQSDEEHCPNIEFEDDEIVEETCDKSKVLLCSALSALGNYYGSSDEEIELTRLNNKPEFKEIHRNSTTENTNEMFEKANNAVDMSSDGEIPEEVKVTTQKDFNEVSSNEMRNELPEKGIHAVDMNSDDDAPEEVKVATQKNFDELPSNNVDKNIKHVNIARKNNMLINQRQSNIKKIARNRKSKLPSTLLQKLLQNEIRQERNIVLQCIRYIKRNNYFETNNTPM